MQGRSARVWVCGQGSVVGFKWVWGGRGGGESYLAGQTWEREGGGRCALQSSSFASRPTPMQGFEYFRPRDLGIRNVGGLKEGQVQP